MRTVYAMVQNSRYPETTAPTVVKWPAAASLHVEKTRPCTVAVQPPN
jgi:hypothetical protein